MTDDNAKQHLPLPSVQTVSFSGRYLVMVGGLMILIVAMMAVLWVRERSRRVDAEAMVVELKRENAKLQLVLGMTMKSGPAMSAGPTEEGPSLPRIQPFQRQDQFPVPVTLNGVQREAYRLPADAAARFGFREGDVILVMPRGAPTSTPASAPIEAP